MRGLEEHLEVADDDSDESEDDREERKDNMLDEEDSDDVSTDYEMTTLLDTAPEKDNELTDDEAGEVEEGKEEEIGEDMSIGDTVTKEAEDDPDKKSWTRIAALPIDPRTEEHHETVMKNLRITDDTTELDIFLALLPLSPERLLEIVRDGSERCGDKLKWTVEHIFSALCMSCLVVS